MSREMKAFSSYFMQGLALGASWADKWEARQIAKERNKLKAQQDAVRNQREERKLGLYGQNVMADIALKQARTHRTMNPVAKGGGKADPLANPGLDALTAKWQARDGMVLPKAGGGNVTNNIVEGSEDTSGENPAVEFTSEASTNDGDTQELARGGMIRKMAGGGSIEEGAGMSIGQAMSYGSKKPKQSVGGGIGGALAAGVAKGAASKIKDKITEDGAVGKPKATPSVTPTGPQGSGGGGEYTVADAQPGGVLDLGLYRSGGRVRRYADGGAVGGDLTQDFDPQKAQQDFQKVYAETQPAPTQQADSGGSANGGTAGAGVAGEGSDGGAGGSSGTSGAGSGSDAGGGPGADGGAYRQGGSVRRFQSGGRVMRAIDTGTSGPGSGYGQRAAPPARRY